MKFSWKICFSTILISLIIFSIGGYVLISALFQSTYHREISNAAEENRMLQYSFAAYWNSAVQDLTINEENIRNTTQTMINSMKGSNIQIRISDTEQGVIYDNTNSEPDCGLLESVDADTRGHMLRKTEDGYELQTASAIQIENEKILYLETIRDMTAIFEERARQYAIYLWWMAGLLAAESLCCFGMAVWLLRPLRNLTAVTRKLAEGDLSVRARIDSHDEFGELAGAFNDMADNLEQQFQELEDAARRQEDFIGSFAHELKTPLTSMIGYADMLRSRKMEQEEQFQNANYIFKEGRRLEALSLKLLDLLVIRHQELSKKPVSIKWMAADIQGMLDPFLQKEGISLEVNVEDAVLLIEPDLMKTVLLNLLDNGRKAIDGTGTILLSGKYEENGFAIYVRDSGKGMPKEELSRITEAFYMIDKSRARKQGGAGLGLSICSEIVRRHGGMMDFLSSEGKGTTVRIFLPEEVSE